MKNNQKAKFTFSFITALGIIQLVVVCYEYTLPSPARNSQHINWYLVTTTPRGNSSAIFRYVYDYDKVKPRAYCALESTMRLNISTEVYTRHPESLDAFPSYLKHLMVIKPLNHHELYKDTPFQPWYESGEWESNNLKSFDLADSIRLAIMYKSGGIYSDLDIILFNRKVLETKNKMAHQHSNLPWNGHRINSNFMDFEPRHPFVWKMMEYFVDTYELNHPWGSTGPAVTTGTLLKCLHDPNTADLCQNIERLPKYIFQYIPTGTLRKTLNRMVSDTVELKTHMMSVSYGLHFSNSEIGGDKMRIGGLLHDLMKDNCPLTLAIYENELFE